MLNLDTVVDLGKGITAKLVKGADENEIVRCTLKFTGLQVHRDMVDELIGLPIGLVSMLFDEQGAPYAPLELGAVKRALKCTGTVNGNKPRQVLDLGKDCELTDIVIALDKLGGIMSGTWTWTARGDEVEDVMELLGNACTAKLLIVTPQPDLFRPATATPRHTNA